MNVNYDFNFIIILLFLLKYFFNNYFELLCKNFCWQTFCAAMFNAISNDCTYK